MTDPDGEGGRDGQAIVGGGGFGAGRWQPVRVPSILRPLLRTRTGPLRPNGPEPVWLRAAGAGTVCAAMCAAVPAGLRAVRRLGAAVFLSYATGVPPCATD